MRSWLLILLPALACTEKSPPPAAPPPAPPGDAHRHPLRAELGDNTFSTLTAPRSIRVAVLQTEAAKAAEEATFTGWDRMAGYPVTGAVRELSAEARATLGTVLAREESYVFGLARRCANDSWVGARFVSRAGGAVEMALGAPCDQVIFAWRDGLRVSRHGVILAAEPARQIRELIAAARPAAPRPTFLPDSLRGFRAGASKTEIDARCRELNSTLRAEKWPDGHYCVLGKQRRYSFGFVEDRLVTIHVLNPGPREHPALTGTQADRRDRLQQALSGSSPKAVHCIDENGQLCVADPDAPALICLTENAGLLGAYWRGLFPVPIRDDDALEPAPCLGKALLHPAQHELEATLRAQLNSLGDVARAAEERAARFRRACTGGEVDELGPLLDPDESRRQMAQRACESFASLAASYPGYVPEESTIAVSCPRVIDGARVLADCRRSLATFTPAGEPLWAWATLRQVFDPLRGEWILTELESERYRH